MPLAALAGHHQAKAEQAGTDHQHRLIGHLTSRILAPAGTPFTMPTSIRGAHHKGGTTPRGVDGHRWLHPSLFEPPS